MKKINLFLLLMISMVQVTLAAGDPKVSTNPGSFTVFDPFVLTIDVTGTDVEGQKELFLWTWAKTATSGDKDIKGIGSWGSSAEEFKLTATENPNVFTFDYDAVANLTDAKLSDIKQLGVLVKTRDGSAQTNDVLLDLEPIVFQDETCRLFPAQVTLQDVITVVFNKGLSSDLNTRLMMVETVEIQLRNGSDVIFTTDKMPVAENAQGTYQYTFKPELIFPGMDLTAENISLGFKFFGKTNTTDGKAEAAESALFEKNVKL